MKPHYIYRWKDWKELCENHGIDPYENVDFGFDLGGGDSDNYEFLGDIPEKEE